MLVIAPENNRELEKVRKLLAILGQSYQVLFTNLETDLGLGEDSLASLLTYTDPSSREGQPLFFNDLPVPDYWEPWTMGITTYIFDGQKRRGNIILRKDIQSRTVEYVEWLGEGDTVLTIEDYNRYGWRSRKRLLEEDGQTYLEIYYNRNQEEVLHHFVKEGYFLYQKKSGRDQLYANEEELRRALFDKALSGQEPLICLDSKVVPLLQELGKEDLIFCSPHQENLGDLQKQVKQILILNYYAPEDRKADLHYVAGLVDPGTITFQTKALIMTASEEVESLAYLVESLPGVDFHVAALTNMGPKLTNLSSIPNLHLHPNCSEESFQELLASCSLYLDLNHGQEVLAASMRAIESGQLILGLNTTVHYEAYKKLPTVLASSDLLLEKIKDVLQSPEEFTNRIEEQRVILQLARKEDLLAFFNCRGEEAK